MKLTAGSKAKTVRKGSQCYEVRSRRFRLDVQAMDWPWLYRLVWLIILIMTVDVVVLPANLLEPHTGSYPAVTSTSTFNH